MQSGTGAKKIEDIKVGDRVASFEGDKVTESKVSQIFKRERDHYFILTAGDYRVKATAEHPFYIGDGKFKEVSKLKAGDRVFVLEKGRMVEKTLTSIVRVDEKTAVYNMSVDNTETFFANNFAVHNKSTCVYEMGLHNWPTIARTSDTTARINVEAQTEVRPKWTGRDGMTIVVALESADPQVFRSECAGQWASQCVFVRRNLDISQSYTFNVSGLQPGTLYKMVAKVYPLSLICGGKDTIYLSSCRMTPDPLNIASPGQTKTLRTELNLLYPARQTQQVAVSYTSSAPAVATVFSQ